MIDRAVKNLKTCRNETKKSASVRQLSAAALTPLVFDWDFLKPINLKCGIKIIRMSPVQYPDLSDILQQTSGPARERQLGGWMEGWTELKAGQTSLCYVP